MMSKKMSRIPAKDEEKQTELVEYEDTESSKIREHYEKEEETLQKLLILEDRFREHYELTLNEFQAQKDVIDRMWTLSQRYIIIMNAGACCKHPEIYSPPTEDTILQEYNEKLGMLRESNCHMMCSLQALRQDCRVFEKLCSELDMTVESPFIIGDTFHKPISFFMELVSDLFKYFHASTLQLKYRSQQLDPQDYAALDDYKVFLEPSEDFEEYLMVGLTYCKCLRPKPLCVGQDPRLSKRTTVMSII